MNVFYVILTSYGTTALLDDIARVNLVFEEEGRYTRFTVSVHHCPVDGRSTAIAGQ